MSAVVVRTVNFPQERPLTSGERPLFSADLGERALAALAGEKTLVGERAEKAATLEAKSAILAEEKKSGGRGQWILKKW